MLPLWVRIDRTYPDQQADLPGGLWAQVGPESDGSWSWVVFDFDADNAEVASGRADTEAAAKAAVAANSRDVAAG